jgi:hypothetical protein
LDNVSVQLTSLAGGELGLEAPGHIWIDQTAAGWGWSLNGGQMDLSTVLTHEVGHALGFEHTETGVMASRLAPGVQRVSDTPGVSGTTFVTSQAASNVSAASTQTGLATGCNSNALSAPAHIGRGDTLGAVTVDGAFAPPIRGVTALPLMIQDRADNQIAVPFNAAGQGTALPLATMRMADTDFFGVPAPSFRPATGQRPAFGPGSHDAEEPSAARFAPDVSEEAISLFWERASGDNVSGAAARGASGPRHDGNSAWAVALAIGLAQWTALSVQSTEEDSRKRSLRPI